MRSICLALLAAGCAFEAAPLGGGGNSTPDAAAPVDGPVTIIADAAVPDAATGCQSIQLLGNRDFDSTTDTPTRNIDPWVESSKLVWKNGEADGVVSHSGEYLAFLGGSNNDVDVLYQELDIPANADHLVFSVYSHIVTAEGGNSAADILSFLLSSAADAGAPLEGILILSDQEATSGYVQFTAHPTLVRAGERVRLWLISVTNNSQVTSFFIDTLSLVAETCP